MRIMASCFVAIAILLGAVASAAGQGHAGGPPILGYHVVLDAEHGGKIKGELIAVSPDSLWLLRDNALNVFPLADMRQVNVRQSSFGAGTALLWSLVVGAASGVALTAACESVACDCGGVLPAMLLSWTFFGGIAALAVEPSHYAEFRAPAADQLRPYARFPQGMPEAFGSDDPPVLRR